MSGILTIREVQERTGISAHALRYYERIGLITGIGRSANGHRVYTSDDVAWIETLKLLRSTGMPIRRVKELDRLRRQGNRGIEARIAYFVQYRDELQCEIESRLAAIATIDKKIDRHRKMLAEINAAEDSE
ncbi:MULTISPECIES: MerR family transcriptional regulator [unclassified Microbulbifer]|uniref:MerR family transcriptional regulator n=1 Tax=unclassified Microbulbifer TaxID=2619833 RepID=UPI0027E42759|nr:MULTISPECIES: MerR family transcriptional regulator [unclassified Microbulbifer]